MKTLLHIKLKLARMSHKNWDIHSSGENSTNSINVLQLVFPKTSLPITSPWVTPFPPILEIPAPRALSPTRLPQCHQHVPDAAIRSVYQENNLEVLQSCEDETKRSFSCSRDNLRRGLIFHATTPECFNRDPSASFPMNWHDGTGTKLEFLPLSKHPTTR